MSDFLSSLRGVADRVFNGDAGTQNVRQSNAQFRQGSEYREAAGSFAGGPSNGFALQDNYSPQVDRRSVRAANLFASDVNPDKGIPAQLRDTTLDIAGGFVTGALNLTALGASGVAAVTPGQYDFGAPIGQFSEDTGQFIRGLRTQEANDAGQAYSVTQDVLTDENRQQELDAIAGGQNRVVAGAQRIFSDVVDAGGQVLTQPEALSTGIAQGIGSLLLGGPVAKLATRGATLAAEGMAARGLLSPAAARAVAATMEESAMTGSIAAMEGAGAYTQASGQVMGMTHDQLMENSPQYAGLIAQRGDTPQNRTLAQNQIASRAGRIAGAIQAPIAAATGSLVAKFEAAPLAAQTVRGALENVGKEALEEGIQSFSGSLSSNAGVRLTGNVNQDLGEGVGQGLAEGAIFGAGTAGVFAGPAIAAGAVDRIPRAIGQAADRIQERGREINEANSFNPVQTGEAVARAAQPVGAEPIVLSDTVDPVADATELETHNDALQALGQTFGFDPATYQPQSQAEIDVINTLDPEVMPDVWDVMVQASNAIASENTSPEQKTDLAIMIATLQEQVTDESYSQVRDLQSQAIPGGTMAQELSRIIAGQEAIADNPLIRKALLRAFDSAPEVTVEAVEDISTPEGQRAAKQVALQATLTPENIRPEVAERLLKHSANSPQLFSPRQTTALRTSAALTQTVQELTADAERMGVTLPRLAEVANQAQMYDDKKEGFAGKSVRGHYAEVTRFMAQGANDEATEALTNFKNFAQSMANKLEAINASHTSRANRVNTPQTFDAYSQSTGWYKSKPLTVISQSPGSIAFAQQASVDSRFVVDSYNKLTEQYPELGLDKVVRQELNEDLTAGPAKFVAKQTLNVRDKEVTKAVTPVETVSPKIEDTKTQPEPKSDPVPEPDDQLELPLNAVVLEKLADIEKSLADLRRQRDIKEQALIDEPSVLISDTAQAVDAVAEPEAKPEVQATEETAIVEQKKTLSVEEVFPNVIRDTNGDQLLLNGFTMDGEARTRLIGENAITVEQIIAGLQSGDAFNQLTGMAKSKLSAPVTAAYNSAFDAVLTKVFPKMEERLNSSKNFKPYINGADPTNAMRRGSLRLLNVLNRDGQGKLGIDPMIGQAMTLALVDWLAQHAVSPTSRSAEDIARKLKIDVAEVTPELEAAYNSSVTSQLAHESLANTLKQYLGLKAKTDIKNGLTDGLLMSIAGELLDSAEAVGLITATAPIEIGERYVVFMKTNKDGLGLKKFEEGGPAFAGQTTLVSQTVLQDETLAGYTIGKPSGNALRTLQGGGAPTTEEQNTAAKAENAVAQTVNRPMLNVFRHLGTDGVVTLFANGTLSETMNVNDREAKEGQNLAFVSAYETMMGLAQELEAYAQENDLSVEEAKLYREYAYSSVNRLQQQGQFGDQASKLTREMITPYASTLDMTNPNEAQMWRRGIAQALGIKVEKLRPENWEKALDLKLSDPAIIAAVTALNEPEVVAVDKLVQVLKDAGVNTPVQLHALKSVAEFQNADDLKGFFTHMYVEADGVTDGPTNSLIYMRLKGFTAEMVAGLKRGGLLFTAKPTPLHEIFDPENGSKALDTYEIGANRLVERLAKHITSVIGSGRGSNDQDKLRAQSDALMTVMRTLLGNEQFEYEQNEDGSRTYKIGRKQLKNPLTVTVYGSSPSGIADKIAKEMTRVFYSEVSAANEKAKADGNKDYARYLFDDAQKADEFLKAVTVLGKNTTIKFLDKEAQTNRYYVKPTDNSVVTNYSDATKLTIETAAITNMAKAVEAFYVTPMVAAINEGMGSSVDGSKLIQDTTNIMSALAKAAFDHAIQTELKKQKAAGGSMSEGLSPNELKKVLARVSFLFPYMEGDTVTVNVKGLQKGLMTAEGDSKVKTAATFMNNMATELTIPTPAIAGVAGAAYVNISYGDGRMIIKASPALKGGRLMVFDGINLALKDAQANGKAINQTVLDALQSGTPFQDLQKTFNDIRETIDLKEFSDKEIEAVFKDITAMNFDAQMPNIDYVSMTMGSLQGALDDAVLDEKARQTVLAQVHLSSDHMAALGAPASTESQTERVDLGGLEPDEQAARLEAMFNAERSKLSVKSSVRAKPSEDLKTAIDALKAEPSGVRLTDTKRLGKLIDGLNIPSVQKTIIARTLIALENTKWKVAFGGITEANAFAQEQKIPFSFAEGDFGLAVPGRKTIIVANQSSETLAHELIHAATIDRVTAYYADQFSVDEVSREAIQRIDSLMLQWLDTAVEAVDLRNEKIRETVYATTRTVVNLLAQGKQAEALNEFMAWNLANQDLVKLNSTIKVESKLARIAKSVVNALHKMFNLPTVGTDLASNLQFNAAILMRQGMPAIQTIASEQLLMQSSRTRPDLAEVTRGFASVVATADAGFEKFYGPKPSELALGYGYRLAQTAKNSGFPMTNEEQRAFVQVVAAFRANRVRNSKLNVQMDAYSNELIKQLNQSNMMDDPDSQDPGEQQIASDRINLLSGAVDVGNDVDGRTLLVPMFIALGATNSRAQRLFNRVEVQNRKIAPKGTTFDTMTKRFFGNAVNGLMDHNYGLKPNQKVGDEIQKLVAAVIQEHEAEKGLLAQAIEAPTDLIRNANEKITDFVDISVDKTSEGLDFLTAQVKGTKLESFANTANKVVQSAMGVMSKRRVADSTAKFTSIVNQTNLDQELRALMAELMGVNETNVDVLKLVKIARATIHKVRQTYRKLMPQQIVDTFSRKLSQEEWSHIHTGIGGTDAAVLINQGLSSGAVIDLFSDAAQLSNLKASKEADIRRIFGAKAPGILTDAADLASLMKEGKPPHGLVKRNAHAIANRAGEAAVGSYAQTSAEVAAVDGYVSVLVMSQVAPSVLKTLSGLAASDRTALADVLSLIAHARETEMERVPARHQYNVFKGYMPYERQGTFKSVPVNKLNEYTKAGYHVVGSRKKGAVEALYDARTSERVYVATDLSAPSFKQGIMQTVRSTVFGLDAVTGLQHDNPTAGMISDPVIVKQMKAALSRSKLPEGVAPLFNEQGQIYAFERLVELSEVNNAIETQRNAAVSLGQWMGRQHEERQADILNDVLIERLAAMWDEAGRQAKDDEFIDLYKLAETDPVVADALRLINDRDRSRVLSKMNGKFMVRKDMYEQVIGYRSISIGDLWTGNTRIAEENRDAVANYLTGLFGPEAYRRLTVAENQWQSLMGDARVAIVVKSLLVPMINGIANFYQLMANGIGPVDIAKLSAEKLRETHLYAQNHLKYQELENKLAAAKGAQRPDRVRLIETEMRKIEDLDRRLSIWPLIAAGEFTQVTEGLTEDDMEMTRGRVWDRVSKWADKLPPAVKTAGRYAVVAKDTALFEGLARTVAYTDFVAKSVLYEHLTTKGKLSQEEAYLRITNEFVNYDLLGGRMRSKAEEVGLVWFWSFKLRSIKVAASMIRNNPLHALLTTFTPGVEAVGTVLADNMIALVIDNRWDNSLGPQNAFRALTLNPIRQLLG